MSDKIKNAIVGFSLLIVIFMIAYYICRTIFVIFTSINPQLGASLIAASATIIVSVMTVVFSKHLDTKNTINNQLREKKTPIYENIIEFIFKITFADKIGKEPPSEIDSIKFFADTTKDLVIWGSKDIVDAFGKFRTDMARLNQVNDPKFVLEVVEDFLLAIRKDLGHKHPNFKRGDILRIYINDIDTYTSVT